MNDEVIEAIDTLLSDLPEEAEDEVSSPDTLDGIGAYEVEDVPPIPNAVQFTEQEMPEDEAIEAAEEEVPDPEVEEMEIPEDSQPRQEQPGGWTVTAPDEKPAEFVDITQEQWEELKAEGLIVGELSANEQMEKLS